MELTIQLPRSQSFDIEVDNRQFHSAYADTSKMIFLTQGEHTISVSSPEPSMLLWGKILRFVRQFSPNDENFSRLEFKLNVFADVNIVISVAYGSYDRVGIVYDEELLSVCHDSSPSI